MLAHVRAVRRVAVVVLAALILPRGLAGQTTTGAIEGRVVDAQNERPIAGARVRVAGTTIGALTNEAGNFRVAGVPARQVDVTVRMIGYAPLTRSIVVPAGQTSRLDFQINVSALQLDQVVVTGSGQQVEVKKLGNTVAVLQAPQDVPINDLSSLLQAREP